LRTPHLARGLSPASSLWKTLRSVALQARAQTDANTGFWAIGRGVREEQNGGVAAAQAIWDAWGFAPHPRSLGPDQITLSCQVVNCTGLPSCSATEAGYGTALRRTPGSEAVETSAKSASSAPVFRILTRKRLLSDKHLFCGQP